MIPRPGRSSVAGDGTGLRRPMRRIAHHELSNFHRVARDRLRMIAASTAGSRSARSISVHGRKTVAESRAASRRRASALQEVRIQLQIPGPRLSSLLTDCSRSRARLREPCLGSRIRVSACSSASRRARQVLGRVQRTGACEPGGAEVGSHAGIVALFGPDGFERFDTGVVAADQQLRAPGVQVRGRRVRIGRFWISPAAATSARLSVGARLRSGVRTSPYENPPVRRLRPGAWSPAQPPALRRSDRQSDAAAPRRRRHR